MYTSKKDKMHYRSFCAFSRIELQQCKQRSQIVPIIQTFSDHNTWNAAQA